MNCRSARDIFPALLDSRTAAGDHAEARAHLAHCPDCQREFAALSQTLAALDAMPTPRPSPRLRQNFYAMLEEEKHSAASLRAAETRARSTRQAALWRWLFAPAFGCALLALGFFLGRRTEPAPAAAPVAAVDDSTKRELAALREQMAAHNTQIAKMNTLVAYQLLRQQQNPTNERLQEVLASAQAEKPNDKVLDDLLSALAFDPNINVRLRALEALLPHAEREIVRSGVLAALPREQNPLVQIEMIDFVAASSRRDAAPVLEKLAQNEMLDQSVRNAAQRALVQL